MTIVKRKRRECCGGRRLAGFGDAWTDWCRERFGSDLSNLSKCNTWAVFPPWTEAGALLRGIPKENSLVNQIVNPPQAASERLLATPQYAPASSAIGSKLFWSAAIVLGLGAAGLARRK